MFVDGKLEKYIHSPLGRVGARRRNTRCAYWLFALVLAVGGAVSAAGGVTPALTAEHVDWQQCQAFAGAEDLGPAPRAALESLLGLRPAAAEGAPEERSTDPCAAELRYFRLTGVGINAGLYQSWMDGATDLDGQPRVISTNVDMGCYESLARGTVITVH